MTGSRDAEFAAWVRLRRPHLVRTALLLTVGDSHSAEDIVQTTLVRLYLAWPKMRAADDRDAYARRSLINVFTDEVRRPWRSQEAPQSHLPDRPTLDRADEREDAELLYRALSGLPPRMRAAVVLRYFHGLSTRETARALQCSEGTVKSQTARALTKLEHHLGPILRARDPKSPAAPTRPVVSRRRATGFEISGGTA